MDSMIAGHLHDSRQRKSSITRDRREEFHSDKSRIVFCSSFRRMMRKAQVFSLESNTSVRNRLTHSLEVADVGKTIARKVGQALENQGLCTSQDTECMQAIVENACLIHDIGNPPFGHFGEAAIRKWFKKEALQLLEDARRLEQPDIQCTARLQDFDSFDGNPQGFRIVTRLHSDVDMNGLNLTDSTLLAAVKYPTTGELRPGTPFGNKLGVFSTETKTYETILERCGISAGRRYFLTYLVELADDICYCLSDIADGLEKGIVSAGGFTSEFSRICRDREIEARGFLPDRGITNFSSQVSVSVARKLIQEAVDLLCSNIQPYLDGTADKEISQVITSGRVLDCLKAYAQKYIYTSPEVQKIEIAGSQIVKGLLDHYGMLLSVPKAEFLRFADGEAPSRQARLDLEWRVFSQLSKRMVKVYKFEAANAEDWHDEWVARARLLVDYVSGLTDHYALEVYQNFMGISLG